MNRLLTITFDELSIDPDGCAAAVNAACRHQAPMTVAGVAVEPDCLLVAFEPSDASSRRYNFAPVAAASTDDYLAEIGSRYYAGFSLICGFQLRGARWALYASAEKDDV